MAGQRSRRSSEGEPRWERARRDLLEDPVKNANECGFLVSHLEGLVEAVLKNGDDDGNKEEDKGTRSEVVSIVETLQKYFEGVQANEFLRKSESEASAKFLDWNKEQIKVYQRTLRRCCESRYTPAALRAETIFAVLDSIKLEHGKRFQVENLDFILRLVCCGDQLSQLLLEILGSEYFKYADVAYYSMKYLARLCSELKTEEDRQEDAMCNVFDLLRTLTGVVRNFLDADEGKALEEQPCLTRGGAGGEGGEDGEKEDEGDVEDGGEGAEGFRKKLPLYLQEKAMKHKFTQVWLSFLRLNLPAHILKRSLTMLPEEIIPLMTTPILLSDILTNAVDQKGLVGILALHGLFILVVEHGLEYPNFYRKLYNMLTISTFLTKYRAKFYRLVDTFLSTPLIPAYVVAAFIKRFARLAIQAPPHGALLAMTFVFNLVRRHPSCVILLEGKDASDPHPDPYDAAEQDPAKACALESSLWELETLKSHYHHEVQRFVLVFKRDFTKRNKFTEIDIEKFVARSYDETFSRENTKRLKLCGVRLPGKEGQKLF
ncbi:nucleolar complex protein 4 [Chloropicon primus]|uniref:Nucleolar complex protein 4 n=2 Tax=Chloropicon primus TaxID=1764295 RepID=A0A5B8MKE2_9CHLO|nr:nucleolar complex protein 4 [Chloropicon primus]UPR00312.1 nucleolar complex protein 4 [Chloropicon primus]|eukprot:QDZ21098.1 nucleolar complex protein 4 [Chloropicon primus]